jgi:hypothetical protein
MAFYPELCEGTKFRHWTLLELKGRNKNSNGQKFNMVVY